MPKLNCINVSRNDEVRMAQERYGASRYRSKPQDIA
jgi:hypothetical protein